MKIMIIGAGKVGKSLIETFIDEGHDLIVVDSNKTVLDLTVNHYDVKGILGSACDRNVLINADVENVDFFISCTSRDELNILCCVLAKSLGAKRTIARVRDPEFFTEIDNINEDLGLDYAFNPEYRTALEIAQILNFPSAVNVESFSNNTVNLVEFKIEKGNQLIGKTIMEIAKDSREKVLFAIIKRGEELFIPKGDFVIEEDDLLNIIGHTNEITLFCKRLRIFKPRAKSVFIIGGGKIGYYLAKKLLEEKVNVKILENDKERCKALSESLVGATILYGDGSDQSVLIEEGAVKADACVALTGFDEENVIISLFAKQEGVSKVITKVDRESVMNMVKKFGLDTIISPTKAISNQVLRFVRSRQANIGAGINTLYKLHDKVEALEFTCDENIDITGVPIKELKLKPNVLIGGILREGQLIIPKGETCINAGDEVIVITKSNQITALTDILR